MGKLFVIGITGGVGAGKSTILSYLESRYGAVIIIADLVAKALMEPGGKTYEAILSRFGKDLVMTDGRIDTALLSKRIFEQGYGTSEINEMVHPAVIRCIRNILLKEQEKAQNEPSDALHLVVIEAALLFEGHGDELCDEVWYIHADRETRIKRLQASRAYSREKCLAIMDKQMGEDEFTSRCKVVIDNSGVPDEAYKQIDECVSKLKAK